MHKFLRIVLSIIIGLNLYGCSLTPNELKTAEKLIETAPDSALHILQHVSLNEHKSDSYRALYGMLMARVLDKKPLLPEPDSLLDFSIDYYQRHPENDYLSTCYLLRGRMYKNTLQYEQAMNYYLKAQDAVKDKENYLLLGRINFDLGDIYNVQCDYTLARKKYVIAHGYFFRIKDQQQAFYSLMNIGRTYHVAKDYNSAQVYYNKLYRFAADSIQQGVLLQEIAINYYDNKQYDSALVSFRKVIRYPYRGNNKAIRYYFFADLFLDMKQIDSAYYYAKNAFNYAPDIRTQRECYRILVNSESSRGDLKALSQYMVRYQYCSDSIRKIDAQTKGSILETIHTNSNEIQKSKLHLWYSLALALLVVALSYYLYKHLYRRKNKELNATHEVLHQQQKIELHKKVVYKHQDALMYKIETIRATQLTERKKVTIPDKVALDKKIYDELLHFSDTEFFFREMDTILNNLVTKLQTRYSLLNAKEISWCCLYLLKVPTVDIYMLLDYSIGGLKKMRQRLVQKVGLSNVSELNDFLNNILSE